MKKIGLIIQREYLTRVKKKSFIITTLLGPLAMVLILIIPVLISQQDKKQYKILVQDSSGLIEKMLLDDENHKFYYDSTDIRVLLKNFYETPYDILLFIPENVIKSNHIQLFYKKQPGVATEEYIKSQIDQLLTNYKLVKNDIDPEIIEKSKTRVKLITEKINEKGERFETYSMINMFVGLILSIFVYLFIFLYGTQVMRGVLEEKTNRIVEIIISSVKPIELMMGKITGIALVALTQFVIWIIAVLILYSAAMSLFLYKYDNALKTEQLQKEILIEKGPITGKNLQSLPKDVDKDFYYMYKSFKNIDFTAILFSFAFYFLFGYLMYAALYAAIGAAVDNDADSQQFLVPVSVPLILGYVISSSIFENPEGTVAFWFSIIPLTSPIVMMIRLPFGVPMWELLLSMVLVVVGFVFFTWLAAKIYRTGILLYGQKVTWKDLFLWIKAGK